MPNISELAAKVKDCYCTTLDLSNYFSQLELDSASRNTFNFYYKDHVMSYNRAPQGWQSSPFYGVLALKLTFSAESREKFLETFPEYRQWEIFQINFETFQTWFQDDGLLLSPFKYGVDGHLALLKYVFFCFQHVGLKISTHKMRVMQPDFEFLGVWYSIFGPSIPSERLSAFKTWSPPTNMGILNSRLSTLAYYSPYLPYLKIIAQPLLQLAKSDKFVWTKIHAQSWGDLMFTLNFATTLTTVSPSDKLIITTDSSCLGCGFSLLKVADNLDLQPVWLESRVFSETERNAPIVLKEALGVLLAIRRCESYIRASQKPVLLLSDAISISYLKQNKNHSPKLAELANLLATMPNILPVFLAGRYNVLADQLSRSVHKTAINEAAPDPSISELIFDV